jgi:hypothetical protein
MNSNIKATTQKSAFERCSFGESEELLSRIYLPLHDKIRCFAAPGREARLCKCGDVEKASPLYCSINQIPSRHVCLPDFPPDFDENHPRKPRKPIISIFITPCGEYTNPCDSSALLRISAKLARVWLHHPTQGSTHQFCTSSADVLPCAVHVEGFCSTQRTPQGNLPKRDMQYRQLSI